MGERRRVFVAAKRTPEEAAALRAERERQGLSLTDLAARSGLERSAISKLETGKVLNPNLSTLRRYAAALGKQLTFGVRDLEPAGR